MLIYERASRIRQMLCIYIELEMEEYIIKERMLEDIWHVFSSVVTHFAVAITASVWNSTAPIMVLGVVHHE